MAGHDRKRDGGGDLHRDSIRTTGPAFNAVPFDPAKVSCTTVGTGTLTFSDPNNGRFAYSVDGVQQTKVITRQVFGPLPNCAWSAQPDLVRATNYQDLWWVPGGTESGWGVNLTHQGDIIFATWFIYDFDGSVLWLAATTPKVGAVSTAARCIERRARPLALTRSIPIGSRLPRSGR